MPSRANSWSRLPSTRITRTIGGNLLDLANEMTGDGSPGVVERHGRHVVRGGDVTGCIERVRLGAEHDLAGVPLATSPTNLQQARRRARPRRRAHGRVPGSSVPA